MLTLLYIIRQPLIYCVKKSELIAFRTTLQNHKYLQALAKEDERSVSWILDKMIEYFRDKGSPSDTVKKIRK